MLKSNSGFGEDGLSISTESTSTGLFGTIDVTRGVGDQLVSSLAAYTDPTVGILRSKSKGLEGTVDRLQKDIEKFNARIDQEGERFRDQLIRLESLLGKLQATSNYLSNQLANLPTIGKRR